MKDLLRILWIISNMASATTTSIHVLLTKTECHRNNNYRNQPHIKYGEQSFLYAGPSSTSCSRNNRQYNVKKTT